MKIFFIGLVIQIRKIRFKLFTYYPTEFMKISFDAFYNCANILQSGYRIEKHNKKRKSTLDIFGTDQADMSLFSDRPFDILLFLLLLSNQCDEAFKSDIPGVSVYIDSKVFKDNFLDISICILLMPVAVDCISSLPLKSMRQTGLSKTQKQNFELKSKIIPQFDRNNAREFLKKQGLNNIYIGINFPKNFIDDKEKFIKFLDFIIGINSTFRIVIFNNLSQELTAIAGKKFSEIIPVYQLGLNKLDLLGLITEIDVFVGQYDIYSLIAQTYEVPCLVYGKKPNYLTDVVKLEYGVENFSPKAVSQFLNVVALDVNLAKVYNKNSIGRSLC